MRYNIKNKFKQHIDCWFFITIKTLFFAICLWSFFGVTSSYAQKVQVQEETEAFVKGEVYIKIKDEVEIQKSKSPNDVDVSKFLFFNNENKEKFGVNEMEASFYFAKSEQIRRIYKLKFDQTEKVDDLIKELSESSNIEFVTRVYNYQLCYIPNDLGSNTVSGQYALHRVNALDAWDLAIGDPNIVVAVVDDAIQTDHEDLAANMVPGYDIADNDTDPNPINDNAFHGTHVAGIAGATTNNNTGMASIGHGISIMPVKIITDGATFNNPYAGITWAADNGANVINLSWTRYAGNPDPMEQLVINNAYDQGAIIVAAAGNAHIDCKNWPAAYDNVFSVASTDINDFKTSYNCFTAFPCSLFFNDCSQTCIAFGPNNCGSTYGNWIDISAPGDSIYSTMPTDDYEFQSGTSMASPLVAGLCGLILSVNPNLSQAEVLNCITSTAVDIDPLNPGFAGELGAGRIDAYEAVLCASGTPPPLAPGCCEAFSSHPGPNLCSISPNPYDESNMQSPNQTREIVSGTMICLLPGFKTDAVINGSLFFAHINDCVYDNAKLSDTVISESLTATNYPNPFERFTEIAFTTATDAPVYLFISDISGKRVSTIIDGEVKSIGTHKFSFDANHLPAGIYYCTLKSGSNTNVHKMVIAK